jgi:hypothetical protein
MQPRIAHLSTGQANTKPLGIAPKCRSSARTAAGPSHVRAMDAFRGFRNVRVSGTCYVDMGIVQECAAVTELPWRLFAQPRLVCRSNAQEAA